MRTKYKPFLTISACIAIIIVFILGGFVFIRTSGLKHLQNRTQENLPGRIKYQNIFYEYNTDIITFLIMGIDKGKETIEPWEIDDGGNGQADALFLAVLNTKDKTLKVININRNIMTDINIYDEDGVYYGSHTAQIALQHAYGKSAEDGCIYQLETVKNLFYNIPIHGYAAVNIAAVPALNDAVGGVDVSVLEDLTSQDASLVKGSQVHLMGESAYWYVKYRDIDVFASIDIRMARQKQYLKEFIHAAKQSVIKNTFIVFDLYQKVMLQTITDISFTEILYLASILPAYQFDESSFYNVEGETVMGEIYEEFYVDETALYELILDIFYEEVQ